MSRTEYVTTVAEVRAMAAPSPGLASVVFAAVVGLLSGVTITPCPNCNATEGAHTPWCPRAGRCS